jgi:hypothetical protein
VALTPAELFLREALSDGQPHPSVEIEATAVARGINPRSLDRARTKLGISSIKNGVRGSWSMQLPHPKLKPASVHVIWPDYGYATCDTCNYQVLNAIIEYPKPCQCGGILSIRQR